MLIAWFGLTPLQASRTSVNEFSYYAEAKRLQTEEVMQNMALQSWTNQTAKATKKNGESKWRDFKHFYEIMFKTEKQKEHKLTIAERNYLLNKRKKGG